MDDLERYNRTVGALYDAALNPEALPRALESLRQLLDCDVYHLYIWDRSAARPTATWATIAATNPIHRGYNTYYGRIDPRRALSEATTPGEFFACSRHFDARFVAADEFYQDFLIPNGLRYNLGATLYRGPAVDFKIGMLRSTGRPDYSDSDVVLARRVGVHFGRALELLMATRTRADIADAQDHTLHMLGAAVALLDAQGRLLHLSPQGEALLLRSNIGIGRRGLVLRGPQRAAFESAWRRVAANGRPSSLSLRGSADAPAVLATIARLPEQDAPTQVSGACFVVILADSAPRGASAETLREVFGFSAAEAELARDLSDGLSLAESARRRGVRSSTARTQLLALFGKTGTHRQAELVRLLGRLPVH